MGSARDRFNIQARAFNRLRGREGDEDGAVTLAVNDIHAINERMDFRMLEVDRWSVKRMREQRYTDPEENYWSYAPKPMHIMVPFGLLGTALLAGQHLLYINYLGWADVLDPWTGYVRLGLILLGAYMLFIAWPWRYHNRMTPQEARERTSSQYDFARRMNRVRRSGGKRGR